MTPHLPPPDRPPAGTRLDGPLVFPGTLIPKNCVETLKETLSSDAVSVTEQTFERPDALE